MEEAQGDPTELWPDNLDSVNVFISMMSQWRITYGAGATGLDYSALPAVFEARGIPQEVREQVFDDLRIMEDAALDVFRENSKQR